MVYDCFIFNGEFELLDIRLRTHAGIVDEFVIVEGNRNFRGTKKRYVSFDIGKEFPEFTNRIQMHLFSVPVFNEPDGAWLAMAQQRNAMIYGLEKCRADDYVIFSEIDEILRPEKIQEAVSVLDKDAESVVFKQDMFCYYLNVKDTSAWEAVRMLKFGTVLRNKWMPHVIRNAECFDKEKTFKMIDAGWHFQNLGGVDRVVKKLKSSCHHELEAEEISNPDIVRIKIENLIEPLGRKEHKLSVVDIDSTYPMCVCEDTERYKHLIYEKEKM